MVPKRRCASDAMYYHMYGVLLSCTATCMMYCLHVLPCVWCTVYVYCLMYVVMLACTARCVTHCMYYQMCNVLHECTTKCVMCCIAYTTKCVMCCMHVLPVTTCPHPLRLTLTPYDSPPPPMTTPRPL